MAKVKVTHKKLTSDEAKERPKMEAVPIGRYHSIIMNTSTGVTRHKIPLSKISVEFQLVAMIQDEGELDDEHKGRRVYQDFILEDDESMPDLSEVRRYELVSLLDAAGVEYDDEGFDTDDLNQKPVIITIRHRTGDKTDEDGEPIIFTNVKKVESAEEVNEDDLV